MKTTNPDSFRKAIEQFKISSKRIIIKPNWVSNVPGEYTEPEIIDWLLNCFPNQEKIILESYTPWRGLKFVEKDCNKGEGVTLEGGKKHWSFYKHQDSHFLQSTGIEKVLKKHNARYINITNEFWNNNSANPKIIESLIQAPVNWKSLFAYIPQELLELREDSTLISLSKIKIEDSIPEIYISMSIKNLFGLIPHPSRRIPFHGDGHALVSEVIKDVYTIYTSLFSQTLWIAEGINSWVKNYCDPKQEVVQKQGLLFVGTNGVEVDSKACEAVGVDFKKVPHLQLLSKI